MDLRSIISAHITIGVDSFVMAAASVYSVFEKLSGSGFEAYLVVALGAAAFIAMGLIYAYQAFLRLHELTDSELEGGTLNVSYGVRSTMKIDKISNISKRRARLVEYSNPPSAVSATLYRINGTYLLLHPNHRQAEEITRILDQAIATTDTRQS